MSEMPEKLANEISEICVSCGMCCDGTLFDRAAVKGDDDRQLAQSINLKIIYIESKDKTFFELPCHLFNGCCSIYDKKRPSICSSFLCKPLRKVKKGELEVSEAYEIITETMKQKKQFEQELQTFPELKNKSILHIHRMLFKNRDESEQRTYRKKYAILYLKGIKLFPLIRSIRDSKKRTNK